MKAAQDFNYKVALASGLRELQAGRLRQAEEQFRYLCARFPAVDGGYRGLAKVLVETDDRAAAIATLRDGAGKLAKAGEHAAVIGLLNEALQLDPLDLAAHRRLGAALALAGEIAAAADEYVRYARTATTHDPDGARREVRYGLDAFGSQPALASVAAELGVDVATPARPMGVHGPAEPAPSPAASTLGSISDLDLRLGAIPGLPRRVIKPSAAEAEPRPVAEPIPLAPQIERVEQIEHIEDPMEADLRAAEYIAAKDPRAAQAALIAARHFIADGRTNAASDLLLQLIASGLADHEAQRLLVEVVSSIGKRDVAKAKCALLAQALRLDGKADLAVEVERLAQAV
ncbi:MAG TPA: hypothetical protein VHG53_04295 [Candidatus Limnocylindria bacterium]|nr:hypothetical protein [Candidatus Limnocylindria bacterium]